MISAETTEPQTHSFFVQAFEVSRRPKLIVDHRKRVVAANRSARRILGFDRLPERLPAERILQSTQGPLNEMLEIAASGGSVDLGLSRLDGSNAQVTARVTAISQPGDLPSYLVIFLPKQVKGQSDSLHEEAEIRVAEAEQLRLAAENHARSLEQFVGLAAHDMKAPLRNIEQLLDLALDAESEAGAETTETLAMARDIATRLQRLIGELLDHAKSREVTLDLRPTNLRKVMEEVEADCAAILRESGGVVRLRGDWPEVRCDAKLVRHLLQNLLSNALKYRLPDRPAVVDVTLDAASGVPILVFRDNGMGFSPSEADRIFEPFQRLHASSEIEGSGLGLSTCRTICERHGWKIVADGARGQGACFTITMRAETLVPPAPVL